MYPSFLFEREIPAVKLDDQDATLLYNFRTKQIARVSGDGLSPRLYAALAQSGFLSNPEPYKPSPEDGVAKLVLIMTNRCNLNCRYCYNDTSRQGVMMREEIITDALDATLRKKSRALEVSLYGGEPSLNRKGILHLLKELKQVETTGIPIYKRITSNGTLPFSIIDALHEAGFHFTISFDGTEESQNFYRPFFKNKPSYDEVMSKLVYLAQIGANLNVRTVITDLNVSHMAEIVKSMSGFGVRKLTFGPVEINVGRGKSVSTRPKLEDYIHNYFRAKKVAGNTGIRLFDHLHILLNRGDSRLASYIFVMPDGSLTFNSTVIDRNDELAELYVIADYNDGEFTYKKEVHDELIARSSRFYHSFCIVGENCSLAPICLGRYKCYEFTNQPGTQLDNYECVIRRNIFSHFVIEKYKAAKPIGSFKLDKTDAVEIYQSHISSEPDADFDRSHIENEKEDYHDLEEHGS